MSFDKHTFDFISYEQFSIYKQDESNYETIRVYKENDSIYRLKFFSIDATKPECVIQKHLYDKEINSHQCDSIAINIKNEYSWQPFKKSNSILFIQIKPGKDESDLQLLDIRQKVENDSERAIRGKCIGEWFASDVGPGGGNILFSVNNMRDEINEMKYVFYQNKLEDKVIIGRRICTSEEDWFYEVVYPQNYL
jgi:hypothetical protein